MYLNLFVARSCVVDKIIVLYIEFLIKDPDLFFFTFKQQETKAVLNNDHNIDYIDVGIN